MLLLDWGEARERSELSVSGHVEQLLLPLLSQVGEPAALVGCADAVTFSRTETTTGQTLLAEGEAEEAAIIFAGWTAVAPVRPAVEGAAMTGPATTDAALFRNGSVLRPDGRSIGAGDVYGYYVITRQYYDRYRLPVMHTETNRTAKHAVEWLWKEWMNLLRLREDGVPIVGFTWFGLVDMKDWDTALTKMRGTVNTVGLYTLQRKARKVAKEYRRLVEEYSHLPISSTKFPILTA